MQIITSPERFADWFNTKVPGTYRDITPSDIRLLSECGLIKRYGYYLQDDLQTVIGILNYEQLREKKIQKQEQAASDDPPRCKLCGKPLPPEVEGKKGRPKEYCQKCESLRAMQRYRKWHAKRILKQKRLTVTEAMYN